MSTFGQELISPVTSVTPRSLSEDSLDHAEYAVVVATRNRGSKIVQLIESIQSSEARDFELVIVDQSSNDETERAITPFLADPRIRYVHSNRTGLSCGRNLGIALTRAPIIAITDDDCIMPGDWLAGIARPFSQHPQVGVVFSSVKPVPVDELGLTPHIIFDADRMITSVTDVWSNSSKGLPLGAGMAIRRAMLVDVQGFDEMLGAGAKFGAAEDSDLSWRGLLHGWFTFQCADVAILHDGFRDLGAVRDLVSRDFYGIGGAIAKYLRAGQWQIFRFLVAWIVRFGVILPARDVMLGGRPRGFRRPYMLMRGLVDGLRTPMDRDGVVYQANSFNAVDDESFNGTDQVRRSAVRNER